MDDRIVAAPDWGWWIILYFFFGGIAAGAYFMGTLIDLVGEERDRPIARLAYYIAAPLAAVCGVLLIVDLNRPERFWHMVIQSNTGLPMFKYWSPMSVGSWGLLLFSAFSGASFFGALAEDRRFGLSRLSGLARNLHNGPIGIVFQIGGTLAGFFLAGYTGALLTATNQPVWSDSPVLAGLFLVSAASTGIATLLLLTALLQRSLAADALANLERTDRWAMLLEVVLLVAFVLSLGQLGPAFMTSPYGILLLIGTLLVGIVLPLALHFRPRLIGRSSPLIAALLVLIGGFILRYAIVMAGQHIAVARL